MPARPRRAVVAALCTALALTFLSGCFAFGTTGSGRLVSETATPGEFDSVEVGTSFEVTLRRGGSHEVLIEADDNLIHLVEVEVRADVLTVRLRRGASVRSATLRAEVTAPGIRSVDASGAATVELADGLEAGDLELALSGASRVVGPVTAERVTLRASGASTARLSGDAGEVDAEASGASSLELDDLDIGTLRIELTGASDASATVHDVLDATASGASDLRYAGDAAVERSDTSGASSITRR